MLAAYKNLTLAIVNLVNSPRGDSYDHYRSKLLLKPEQHKQLLDTAKMIVDRHLALGTVGELSLRLSSNQLAITAKGSHLAHLTETDLVTCSTMPGKPNEAAAFHLNWHCLIYRETPAESVLLCQPPYSLTLANAAKLPLPEIAPQMWETIGGVSLLNRADLTEANLAKAVQHSHAIMLPQFGALVWGNSTANALVRTEAFEFLSRLTVMAYQTGLIPILSSKKSINRGG